MTVSLLKNIMIVICVYWLKLFSQMSDVAHEHLVFLLIYWLFNFFLFFCNEYKLGKTSCWLQTSLVMMVSRYFFFNIACDPGTYGQRCGKRSGYCWKKENCFHTNGTCLNGCDPGYSGDLCNACVFIFFSCTKHFKMMLDLKLISDGNIFCHLTKYWWFFTRLFELLVCLGFFTLYLDSVKELKQWIYRKNIWRIKQSNSKLN